MSAILAVLAFAAAIAVPIAFVFSMMYAIKFLLEDSFYAFIWGGVASLCLILMLMLHVTA